MPLYEWQCITCKNYYEAFVKLVDLYNRHDCPDCGGQLKVLISPVDFRITV